MVTNCIDFGVELKIKTPPQTIFFYVSRILLIKNILFEGLAFCTDSATNAAAPSFSTKIANYTSDADNSQSMCLNKSILSSGTKADNFEGFSI
jgi:hypothetical protein